MKNQKIPIFRDVSVYSDERVLDTMLMMQYEAVL